MRSNSSTLRIGADEQQDPGRLKDSSCVPIERLEERRLLSGFDSTLALSNDDFESLPNLLGIYRGRIVPRQVVGISPGRLTASLRIDRETVGGQVEGSLGIRGVGAFDVTGIVTGNDVNLSFTNGSSGILTGEVTSNGKLYVGRIFAQFNDTAVRGNFRFDKRITFPFVNNRDKDGFFFVHDRSPAFGAGFGSGINFGSGAGFGSNVDFSGFDTFFSSGFSATPPSFGFSPLDTGFGTRPITRAVSGFVPIIEVPFTRGFSAGAVLQNPISAGSVLASRGQVLTDPFVFNNTTPIGSRVFVAF